MGMRFIFALLILGMVFGAGYIYFVAGKSSSQPQTDMAESPQFERKVLVEALAARTASIEDTLEAVGSARAHQSIDIVSDTSGRIKDILFVAGQHVAKGDVLVVLDSAVEEANLAEAKAILVDARQQVERARALLSNRTIPQARVDELEAGLVSAQARLDVAEKRLADRKIKAPFTGYVGLGEVDIGARITDDTRITTLDDLSVMEVEFPVPEVFFSSITLGQTLTATSLAFPSQVFVGEVSSIDTRVDEQTRSFRVRASIPNPAHLLPSGLFMTVTLTIERKENAVLIAEESVIYEGEQTYVFVISEGRAERRDVVLGLRKAGQVDVMNGVISGELVVTSGLQRLRDGVAVEVLGINPPASFISEPEQKKSNGPQSTTHNAAEQGQPS